MRLESDFKQLEIDIIGFNDFVKDNKNIGKISPNYQYYIIMDILHLSKSDIEKMGLIEYEEAFNYSVITYKLRNMASTEKSKPKDGEINFDQPANFGIDPNFVSNVGK